MYTITKEMHYKAIVVSVDIGGRIRLKLDGHVSHRGVESESREETTVLAQDVGCEVITIIKGQQVILPQMKTNTTTHMNAHH